MKSGNFNFLEPSGPLQACNGTALPLPLPIVQEAGWAPGPVWTGAENLASTGLRSSDRPARSQSLFRLSYPAHDVGINILHKVMSKLSRGIIARFVTQ